MRLIPCQMTMDMLGIRADQLIDGVEPAVGAAAASRADDQRRCKPLHLREHGEGRTHDADHDSTPATRTVDARGSFCPGPLMELIRAIREGQIGDVIAVLSSDAGSKLDIPKWVEKAGHRLVALEAREGYDEIVIPKLRWRRRREPVVILGGGVGGTLTANLLVRRLRDEIKCHRQP